MRWKAGERPIRPWRGGLPLGHAQGLHLLDEVGLLATGIAQRHQLDVDVVLALGVWCRCSTRSRWPDSRARASGQLSPAWSQGTLKWCDTS
jgi:hypothetical protein